MLKQHTRTQHCPTLSNISQLFTIFPFYFSNSAASSSDVDSELRTAYLDCNSKTPGFGKA